MVYFGRTDLASEAGRRCLGQQDSCGNIPGLRVQEHREGTCSVCSVEIETQEAAHRVGKPMGHYVTLEYSDVYPESFPVTARLMARLLKLFLPSPLPDCVCIATLGNPDITPDAIGPLTASQILVTRHLKQSRDPLFSQYCSTALCRAGVLGLTGLESANQISAFCREVRAKLVIAVDALAGSDSTLLCRSIQICDSGISPGSGVGNDRQALSRESLGLPVIAIGAPTVLDASNLSRDSRLERLFVTPRSIDSDVRFAAKTIAYGINLALQPHLRLEEINSLIG